MPRYLAELASTGRAKCRGCERLISKGMLRFGEVLENPRADGRETTFWYHPVCAAYKRPAAILEFLDGGGEWPVDADGAAGDSASLRGIAEPGLEVSRLTRLHRAVVSPSARATCRACRELIAKDTWRISVVFFEDGYLNPAGYIHAGCVAKYAETTESAVERVRHFNLDLSPDEIAELTALIEG